MSFPHAAAAALLWCTRAVALWTVETALKPLVAAAQWLERDL